MIKGHAALLDQTEKYGEEAEKINRKRRSYTRIEQKLCSQVQLQMLQIYQLLCTSAVLILGWMVNGCKDGWMEEWKDRGWVDGR